MTRRASDDRGSATLPALACLGVLVLVGAALGVVGALVTAHRSAQSAADLAALAAAAAMNGAGAAGVPDAGIGGGTGAGAPAGDPCAAGAAVASANGARMSDCRLEGRTAVVRVVVTGPHWLGQDADLEATARAGPVEG